MTRPLYETKHDRANENAVIDLVEEAWRATFVKFPIECEVEGALYRGRDPVAAILEVKRRYVHRGAYNTLAISARKIAAGKEWAKKFGVPFILVVAWDDGVFWFNVRDDFHPDIRRGGRWDRGDPQDVEEMAHIPVIKFKEL